MAGLAGSLRESVPAFLRGEAAAAAAGADPFAVPLSSEWQGRTAALAEERARLERRALADASSSSPEWIGLALLAVLLFAVAAP